MFIAGHQLQKLKACEWTLCVVLQSSFIFFFRFDMIKLNNLFLHFTQQIVASVHHHLLSK